MREMQIKNVKVYGLAESAVRAGYPMQTNEPEDLDDIAKTGNRISEVDRIKRLSNVKSGTGHDCALKGIIVQFDLQYPEYFSPQLQRYSWIDIISSQSKMHRITSRELTKDDFTNHVSHSLIKLINGYIQSYSNTTGKLKDHYFNRIISSLPSGYLKWMGISTNYLQLKTIWNQRCKHKHKLDEWRIFGEFIKELPMSELIIN